MKIDQDLCVGCGNCRPYCPVGAIVVADTASIDSEACLECGMCLRSGQCPVGAIYQDELIWPRQIRAIFSNVAYQSPNTGVLGRGTEEMKTNDVSGRLQKGRVCIAIEMGRPGIGTTMADVEKMAKLVAGFGAKFEKCNPMYPLLADPKTGKFLDEVLGERALSAIIEVDIDKSILKDLLIAIREMSHEIDTVFSLDVATVMEGEVIPTDVIIKEAGFKRRLNGKTNVGLGKPKKECV